MAHPGHELRVHGWLEARRPEVHVLTDGAGHGPHARLDSTTVVLERAGATRGRVYGRFSDREFYEAMLRGRVGLFVELARELAIALAERDVEIVVCDSIEGYNPSHDLCRLIAGTAVNLTARRLGRPIAAYSFPLVGRPDDCPAHLRGEAIRLELDEPALGRKLQAAARYPELRGEVDAALGSLGAAAFAVECLRPHDAVALAPYGSEAPFYERHGARRVTEGVYREALTFRAHLRPIAEALVDLVSQELVT